MTRYVIVGAGAVGATVAAQLHLAGASVLLVARGAHLEALRTRGLQYVRPDAEHLLSIPVIGGPDEVDLQPDDVLVLATKSQDTETVLQAWAHQPVGRSSAAASLPILLLQNGLDNERAALRRFATVLGAVVWLPATHLSSGEVVAPGMPAPGAIWLGAHPGGVPADAERVAGDLRAAGFLAQPVADILRWKAAKLLANLGNVLDALYAPSALRSEITEAVRAEGRLVLSAHGIEPHDLAALDLSAVTVTDIPGRVLHHSSTWQSMTRAGSLETDFLNGEIVLLARLAQIAAPYNEALQRRIPRAVREGTAAGSLTDTDLTTDLPNGSEAGLSPSASGPSTR